VNVPRKAPEFADVLRRARDALRAAAEAGTLPPELRTEGGELLREEEHHPHRRWRPSPS
jgi:hypothetical protein